MPSISLPKPPFVVLLMISLAACQTAPEGGGKAAAPAGEGAALEVDAPKAYEDPGGALGLVGLTEMALARSPEVAAAQGTTRVAKAQTKAVWDMEIRDPELRTSFSWDDVRVNQVGNDNIRRNEGFQGRVRFYPPNPFEMRAILHQSLSNERYADFLLNQAARGIILEVRRVYQELQFLEERLRLSGGEYAVEQEEYERLEALLQKGQLTRDDVIRAEYRALGARNSESSDRRRFQQKRAELAGLVGLSDPTRIRVDGVPDRRRVAFGEGSFPALVEFAYVNSPELGQLQFEEEQAAGDLDAFSARKIPWLSFIEMGSDLDIRDHQVLTNEYGVRTSLTLPVFSWMSSEDDLYKAQIESYREQAVRHRKKIEQRLAAAISQVRLAERSLAEYDGETEAIMARLKALETDRPEMTYVVNEQSLNRRMSRLELEQAYHDALLDLEEVIRGDIEEVFSRESRKQ